ncbi:MAG: LCP family protein [Clostridia bacterium]|nr:LCP family protein [Clostridia bacterium]
MNNEPKQKFFKIKKKKDGVGYKHFKIKKRRPNYSFEIFKRKMIAVIVYFLVFSMSVTAGITIRGFKDGPFGRVSGDDVLLAAIETTNGKAKVNVLIVGVDKSKYLSDVIMVVRYDEELNKVMAMSIPRDTYVNYNGTTMLINSVYGAGKRSGGEGGGINAVSKKVTELTGLKINYYVQFEVGTFAKLVDELGGVAFNVPQNMDYEDPAQDLYIHVRKGQQILNGKDAESMVRFRGYPQADLKRVEVQQDLFKALIQQKLSASYITKIPSVYAAIRNDVKCNMELGDMLIYGKSMLGLDTTNGIYTCTMPTYSARDAHLLPDRHETDKVMELYFHTDGPIINNPPYSAEETTTN